MGQPDPILSSDENVIDYAQYGLKPYHPTPAPTSSMSLSSLQPSPSSSSKDKGKEAQQQKQTGTKTKTSSRPSSRPGTKEYIDPRLNNSIKTHYNLNIDFENERNADNLLAYYPKIERGCCPSLWNFSLSDRLYYKFNKYCFFASSAQVKRYWGKALSLYEPIYQAFSFPIIGPWTKIPSNLNNYLSAQVWMASFGLKALFQSVAGQDDEITSIVTTFSPLFANLIHEAWLTEELLRTFKGPLTTVTEVGLELIRGMRHALLLQQTHPHAVHNTKDKSGFRYEGDYNQNYEIESDDLQIKERFYSVAREARAPARGDKKRTINLAVIAYDQLLPTKGKYTDKKSKTKNGTDQKQKDAIMESATKAELLCKVLEIFVREMDFDPTTKTTTKKGKNSWTPLSGLKKAHQIKILIELLSNIISTMVSVREQLVAVLAFLKDGSIHKQYFVRKPTLLRHLNDMSVFCFKGVVQHADYVLKDEIALIREIRRVERQLYNIIGSTRELVALNLGVLAMSQLSYTYLTNVIRSVETAVIPIRPYTQLIEDNFQHYKTDDENGSLLVYQESEFEPKDFYATQFESLLRKVPVISGKVNLILSANDLMNPASSSKDFTDPPAAADTKDVSTLSKFINKLF